MTRRPETPTPPPEAITPLEIDAPTVEMEAVSQEDTETTELTPLRTPDRAAELVQHPESADIRTSKAYLELRNAYTAIGSHSETMTESEFNDMLDMRIDGVGADGKPIPEAHKRAAELFDAELQLWMHTRESVDAAEVSPEVVADMEGTVSADVLADMLNPDRVQVSEFGEDAAAIEARRATYVEEAKREAVANSGKDTDPDGYRNTPTYAELQKTFVDFLGNGVEPDKIASEFREHVARDQQDALELGRPEIAEVYTKFLDDIDNEANLTIHALREVSATERIISELTGTEINLPKAIQSAKEHLATRITDNPEATQLVADLSVSQIQTLSAQAEALETMGRLAATLTKKGREAKRARKELMKIVDALNAVETTQQIANASEGIAINPSAETGTAEGAALDINPSVERARPLDTEQPTNPKRFMEVLQSESAEIGSELTRITTGELSAAEGTERIINSPLFSEWKQNLKGATFLQVKRGDGKTFPNPLTVSGMRRRNGEMKIYFKNPDGRTASMSLEVFFRENLKDVDQEVTIEAPAVQDRANEEPPTMAA